jgi:hypothetical protein
MTNLDQILQDLVARKIIKNAKQRRAIRQALIDYAFWATIDPRLYDEVHHLAYNCGANPCSPKLKESQANGY